MALTKDDVKAMLQNEAESIEMLEDDRFLITGARDTAGALFKKIELHDYCFIEAELDDDRGYYKETVIYEQDPEDDPQGVGYIVWGLYRRNTDIYGHLAIEASFEGTWVKTNAQNHKDLEERETARFLDFTISLKSEKLEEEAKSLASCIKSRSFYKADGTALKNDTLQNIFQVNRNIAMLYARDMP